MISGALVTFALAWLILTAIAFLLARWLYRHQVSNAKSEAESAARHVALLEAQIKEAGMKPTQLSMDYQTKGW